MFKRFPFITTAHSFLLLRISLAVIFLAHAVVRLFNGTIPRFGSFLEYKGMTFGNAWVWAITVFEIAGGILLALGYYTRILSAGFIILLLAGVVLIHAERGWFVGEHGDGGCEYTFILIIAFIVLAARSNELKK